MSRENVELVRRLLEVYNERSFAENIELIDPEIVWDLSRVELPDGALYTGRLDLGGFVDTWEEGFESEHVEAEEILDAGACVVVFVRHRGRGRLSGIEVTQTFAMVWTLRDGRAVRMDMYPTRGEALEAAGLSQENVEFVKGLMSASADVDKQAPTGSRPSNSSIAARRASARRSCGERPAASRAAVSS